MECGFSNLTLACSDSPARSCITWSCLHCFYISFLHLSFDRRSLVLHADLLLPLPDFLHVRMDHFWAERRWSSKNQPGIPLISRAVSQEILPSRSLNRPRPALLESMVMILLIVVLCPLGILNSTISYLCPQGCPSLYPQTVVLCS